jgi:hypothetical protein
VAYRGPCDRVHNGHKTIRQLAGYRGWLLRADSGAPSSLIGAVRLAFGALRGAINASFGRRMRY